MKFFILLSSIVLRLYRNTWDNTQVECEKSSIYITLVHVIAGVCYVNTYYNTESLNSLLAESINNY